MAEPRSSRGRPGRIPARLIATLIPIAALTALAAAAPDPHGATKSILVTVLDEAGDPLRDLDVRDFIVTEDGKRQEVVAASLSTEPLYVALLVDTAKPVPGAQFPTQDLRRGLAAFVLRALAGTPESEVAIIDVAEGASVVVSSTSRLDELNTWISRLVPSQRATGVLLEALAHASQELAGRPSPRRAIVSVTFDSPESSAVSPEHVADAMVRSGAAYWPVSIRGSGTSVAQTGLHAQAKALTPTREALFTALPGATGGLRVTAVSAIALELLLSRVAEALTAQYEVTYARPDGPPAKVIEAGARRGAKVLRASWVR